MGSAAAVNEWFFVKVILHRELILIVRTVAAAFIICVFVKTERARLMKSEGCSNRFNQKHSTCQRGLI